MKKSLQVFAAFSIFAIALTASAQMTPIKASTSLISANSSAQVSTTLKATSLTLGVSSPTVATYQAYLKTLGYYSGSATGILDSATQSAIMSFQKSNGLSIDGILGTNTEAKISSLAFAKSSSPTINTSASTSAISAGSNSSASSLGHITINPNPIQFCIHSGQFMSAPSITVTSPNGGQTYTAGQQISITWTSCNLPSGVTVRSLVTNFQTGVDTILGTYLPNTGSATLTIPSSIAAGTEYKAQVLVYQGTNVYMNGSNTVYDDSDNYFAINNSSTTSSCSALISSTGTPTAAATAMGGGGTNQTGTFTIPFSVTAAGCNEYVPDTALQLNNNSARNHIQFSINGNGISSSGATGIINLLSGGSTNAPTINGNYEISAGQTVSFILTATYNATSVGSYRASLYDIPSSLIDATQFTGNSSNGFVSNLAPATSAYSTPYIVLQ